MRVVASIMKQLPLSLAGVGVEMVLDSLGSLFDADLVLGGKAVANCQTRFQYKGFLGILF